MKKGFDVSNFFNLSNELLCIASPDGYFLELNSNWTRVMGWSMEELLQKSYMELVHPDDRAETEKVLSVLSHQGSVEGFENRYRCKDGSYKWLRWFSKIDTDQGVIYSVASNVTQKIEFQAELEKKNCELQRQNEELHSIMEELAANEEELQRNFDELHKNHLALELSENKYSQLFDSLLSGFALHEIILDQNGNPCDYRFLDINPAFEKLTGLRKSDILGKTVKEVMPGIEQEWIDKYGKVAIEGESLSFENYSKDLHKYYRVTAFSPQKGQFAVLFYDITETKDLAESLRENEERLNSIFRVAPTGIGVTKNRVLVEVNDKICEMTGYTRDELITQSARMLYSSEEEFNRVGKVKYDQISDKGTGAVETQWVRKDGQIIDVLLSSTPIDKEVPSSGITFTALDISEKNKSLREIKKNEERFKSIVEILQSRPPTTQDLLDLALHKALALTESLYGYIYLYNEERKEFTLNTWSRDVMDDCKVQDPQVIYRLEKTGIWGEAVRQRRPIIVNDFQAHNPHKKGYPEGHVQLTRFMTIPISIQGRIVAVIGMGNKTNEYTDLDTIQLTLLMDAVFKVAAQKEAEEAKENALKALLDSQKRYKELIELTHEGVVIINKENVVLFANARLAEMLGYQSTELEGRNVLDFTSSESRIAFQKSMERRQINGVDDYQIDLVRKDGTLLSAEIRAAATWDENGHYSGSVALIKDVSEERRMQNELVQSERLSAVGQLASGIAHEFNNIMAIIKGNIFLIMEELNNRPDLLDLLSVMDLQITRGASIVSQMMAFARPQLPKKSLMTVRKLLDDIFMLQKSQLELENIRIEKEYNSNGLIQADQNQLQQVFLNLSINARHAIASKGKGTIKVSVTEIDESLKIIFSDDGCGMDDETQRKLFTPFFTTKTKEDEKGEVKSKGTGLGLSVTRNVITNHGGSITVQSRLEEGTTFTIILPIGISGEAEQNDPTEKGMEKAPLPSTHSFSPSLLIIDDEKDLTELVQKILKKAGYTDIRIANKGSDGIRMMGERSADLIFLDKLLPDMNGEEIYVRLKSIKNNLKVIFMSGNAEAKDFLSHPEDMYAFLQKPFEMDDLINLVGKFKVP